MFVGEWSQLILRERERILFINQSGPSGIPESVRCQMAEDLLKIWFLGTKDYFTPRKIAIHFNND
jgi:hypothetical protein